MISDMVLSFLLIVHKNIKSIWNPKAGTLISYNKHQLIATPILSVILPVLSHVQPFEIP